ncbi:PadR family transcriptional regulator [Rhodococcus sp. D2-41]|nr:PadR family transcriptional regulator [Rhodococcus sp. D2-41]
MHPYEMYQLTIERREDRLVKVRPGSLYHTVARLARDELVRAIGVDREGNRPERTTYEITEPGQVALRSWITEALGTPMAEYPRFSLAVAESHNLPKDEVIALLRRRRELVDRRRDELVGGVEDAERAGVPALFHLDIGYSIAIAEAESRWLGATLDDLTSGRLGWLDCLPTAPTHRTN